jgi:heat shock protein HslJ
VSDLTVVAATKISEEKAMNHKPIWSMVWLAATVLVLGGCAAAPTPTPAPATAVVQAVETVQQTKSQFALLNTEWQLESMGEPGASIPVIPGTYPSVGFGLDRYTGFGSCDWYMGVYTAQGDSLRMQQPAKTTAGCINAPAAAQQQSTFMSMLTNTVTYAVKDGKLHLYTSDQQPLMTLSPLESVPFEGTTWELLFYFSPDYAIWTARLPGAKITAKFDGKQLTGNAGCNDYMATYRRNENRLELDTMTVTTKTCAAPEGVMEQEQGYLSMLKSVGVINQYPRSIELLSADGTPRLAYHAE